MIGADVRSRAFATEVLLASIERQAESAAPVAIASLSDQPAGHLAQMSHSRCHEADTGSAILKRQPETLPLADGNIDAKFARRAQQAQCDSFGGGRDRERARAVRRLGDRAKRFDHTERV